MRKTETLTLIALAGLLVLASAIYIATNTAAQATAPKEEAAVARSTGLDETPLLTAQALAKDSRTREERQLASEAVKLADEDLDLAFDSALREAAAEHPAASASAPLYARERAAEQRVEQRQQTLARLKQQLGSSRSLDSLERRIALEQAQLQLEQAQLDDARTDLLRSGASQASEVQHMLHDHQALEHAETTETAAAQPDPAGPVAADAPVPAGLAQQITLAIALEKRSSALDAARAQANENAAKLTAGHDELEREVGREGAQQSVLAKDADALLASGENSGNANTAADAAVASVKRLEADQQRLSAFDKRVEAEQELAHVYERWLALVAVERSSAIHLLARSTIWILLIILGAFVTDRVAERLFGHLNREHKRLLTLRHIVRFISEATAAVLILLVVFGKPEQMSTILALGGAGLTVALQDVIVSFLGWLVLMGRNGIALGDWVEINGVSGEVVEIGILRTIILEAGKSGEPGPPTGRKVSIANSFVFRGHYLNFSTAGQWLWDELHVELPSGTDLYRTSRLIEQIVDTETGDTMKRAAEEWQRQARAYTRHPLPTAALINYRPAGSGVEVIVSYITSAQQRHDVRARLYGAIVEALHATRAAAAGEGLLAG